MAEHGSPDKAALEAAMAGLEESVALDLLREAAEAHEDVARAVRIAAASDDDRIAVLRRAVDEGLRTRRHLDYWASSAWAHDAAPVVHALASEVAARPSADLVLLLQRAAGHLVKVMHHADDSDGMIGSLASDVLDVHCETCRAGVADPQKLAKWMVKFAFADQDFFTVDPVAYVDALGPKGLAAYRREVAKRSDVDKENVEFGGHDIYRGFPSFAARHAAERLAIIDRDVDRLVELLGGDLSSPHQFVRVAEAMVELGDVDAALTWARRGITETDGWQVVKLYDLVAELLERRGDHDGVVEIRRDHHERAPTATTYARSREAARTAGTWDNEITAARAHLAERNPTALIDALLADDEPDKAWEAATSGRVEPDRSQWLRLAEAREPSEPGDAMMIYQQAADESLVKADKRAYRDAVRHLKAARRAAIAADRMGDFTTHLVALREQNKRRPSLIAMLDKAGLA